MGVTTGMRLRAQNSACEVVVIRGADALETLTCAGLEMRATVDGGAVEVADGPRIEVGKRYVDADERVEVLCVKAGVGPLAADGRPLEIKAAKPLPSSD